MMINTTCCTNGGVSLLIKKTKIRRFQNVSYQQRLLCNNSYTNIVITTNTTGCNDDNFISRRYIVKRNDNLHAMLWLSSNYQKNTTTWANRLSFSTSTTDTTTDTTTEPSTKTGTTGTTGTGEGSLPFWNVVQQSGYDHSTLEKLAKQQPTPLKLADIYKYGAASTNQQQRIRNAQFLYNELQIRIAHRIVDLLTLPHGLSEVKPILNVANLYIQYLSQFKSIQYPTTIEEEIIFTDFLLQVVMDRSQIPTSIAAGVQEWTSFSSSYNKRNWTTTTTSSSSSSIENQQRLQEMEDALYRFFTARVGLRFLAKHHVLSSPTHKESAISLSDVINVVPTETIKTDTLDKQQPQEQHEQGKDKIDIPLNSSVNNSNVMRGMIHPNVDIVKELQRVIEVVKQQTSECYNGLCPQIDVVDATMPSNYNKNNKKSEFTHVPLHLHCIFHELLKNSCRACIRQYHTQLINQQQNQQNQQQQTGIVEHTIEIPSIRVIIVRGEEDVTIKVADRGGGIPRSLMNSIWKFAHSTAAIDEIDTQFGQDGMTGTKIRGFGLPLARIYARYFGGELTLKSTEGYGLDAYLHIPRLGTCCENLPLKVRDSPGESDSSIPLFIPKSSKSKLQSLALSIASSSSSSTSSSASSHVNVVDDDSDSDDDKKVERKL